MAGTYKVTVFSNFGVRRHLVVVDLGELVSDQIDKLVEINRRR
jgi:hypothetical protein